ncbi:MaoC/PaaZ C-terminal domain-containing protein [Alteribacter natronophilus]|uniref:MaoC/PaaZ C-terminal domain-containing protein n=1 Tax=Alteribacter natronophilus TaxID=2583810 RepID=UPI00110E63DE|nr:MaoC/PaaZ C-terminal domain-containing protein [Alteribacter natronophilus]TMW71696.1 enoyl-CoA hydratase [Alteribacter natronophilus]
MFTKKRKLGSVISSIKAGEKAEVTKKVEDKDILLYLGLSDDANPIYIQHDYAARTPFKKPIVPQLMINGFVNATVSTHLPGPGSSIISQTLEYPKPLYHYGTLHLSLEVTEVDEKKHSVLIKVSGNDSEGDCVIRGELTVCPPYPWKPVTQDAGTFENF